MASKPTLVVVRVKKKRIVMTLAQKIKILDRLARGEKPISVGKTFNVNESTIRTIKKNSESIRASYGCGTRASLKVTRMARDHNIEMTEKDLFAWIEDQKSRCVPISGLMIRDKAKEMYENYAKHRNHSDASGNKQTKKNRVFHASKGWFENFKKRFFRRTLSSAAGECPADEMEESQAEYDENLDVETGLLVKTKVERPDPDPIESYRPQCQYGEFETVNVQSLPQHERFVTDAPVGYEESLHTSESPNRNRSSADRQDPLSLQRKERMTLEIEQIKLQNYKTTLEILKLERELNLPKSNFTSCFFK